MLLRCEHGGQVSTSTNAVINGEGVPEAALRPKSMHPRLAALEALEALDRDA